MHIEYRGFNLPLLFHVFLNMTLHQMPMKLKGWTQVEDSSRGVISILGTAH